MAVDDPVEIAASLESWKLLVAMGIQKGRLCSFLAMVSDAGHLDIIAADWNERIFKGGKKRKRSSDIRAKLGRSLRHLKRRAKTRVRGPLPAIDRAIVVGGQETDWGGAFDNLSHLLQAFGVGQVELVKASHEAPEPECAILVLEVNETATRWVHLRPGLPPKEGSVPLGADALVNDLQAVTCVGRSEAYRWILAHGFQPEECDQFESEEIEQFEECPDERLAFFGQDVICSRMREILDFLKDHAHFKSSFQAFDGQVLVVGEGARIEGTDRLINEHFGWLPSCTCAPVRGAFPITQASQFARLVLQVWHRRFRGFAQQSDYNVAAKELSQSVRRSPNPGKVNAEKYIAPRWQKVTSKDPLIHRLGLQYFKCTETGAIIAGTSELTQPDAPAEFHWLKFFEDYPVTKWIILLVLGIVTAVIYWQAGMTQEKNIEVVRQTEDVWTLDQWGDFLSREYLSAGQSIWASSNSGFDNRRSWLPEPPLLVSALGSDSLAGQPYTLVQIKDSLGDIFLFFVRLQDGLPTVDWEATSGACEMGFVSLLSQDQPQLMRVILEPSDYYNYRFGNSQTFQSYLATHPATYEKIHVYARKYDQNRKSLRKRFAREDTIPSRRLRTITSSKEEAQIDSQVGQIRVLLRLSRPKGEEKFSSQAWIEAVVGEDWVADDQS